MTNLWLFFLPSILFGILSFYVGGAMAAGRWAWWRRD